MSIRRAGKLRHRVAIERREVEYDNLGHPTRAWKQFATVAAEVKDLSGRELERARQIVAEATVTVELRHLPGLTTECRFKFRDRYLQIGAVTDPDNRQQKQICFCGETK